MIAFYDNQPAKLEAVGNGSYVYRFNIQKVEKPATVEPSELASDDEAPVQEQWKCEEATVWAPLSSNKITETVITEKWDNNREQKLVNEFNAANLVNPAKRKATPIKNEKRFSEQKRKAMKIIKAIPEIVSPLLLHC